MFGGTLGAYIPLIFTSVAPTSLLIVVLVEEFIAFPFLFPTEPSKLPVTWSAILATSV